MTPIKTSLTNNFQKESIIYEYDMWRIGHTPGQDPKSSLIYLPIYFLAQELKFGSGIGEEIFVLLPVLIEYANYY